MASTTAQAIIDRALVKARVSYPGESSPANLVNEVFLELNDMLESWALERLMLYAGVLESFALVVGTAEYTYGDGGDFDSDRPNTIEDSCFVRSGTTDYYVRLRPVGMYRKMAAKDTTGIPYIIAYEPEFPLLKVFLYPTPSEACALHVKATKQLKSFTDLTTLVSLPEGYRRAIITNLVTEIAPNFGKKVSDDMWRQAIEAKRNIKHINRVNNKRIMSTPQFTRTMGGRTGGNVVDGWNG